MNFPDWAPKELVHYYGSHLSKEYPKSDLPKEVQESIFTAIGASATHKQEVKTLLEKYLNDERMKEVWNTLKKRTTNDMSYIRFLNRCQNGVHHWRINPKLTKTEFKNHFNDINETASKLLLLLNKYHSFGYVNTTDLIDDKLIESLLDVMDSNLLFEGNFENEHELNGDKLKEQLNYTRSYLSDVVPTVDKILENIANKSKEDMEHVPVIKQPNSPNAHLHYFIKTLSHHMLKEYDQPLHKVVAITTAVTFDLDDYDENTVRKIVTG